MEAHRFPSFISKVEERELFERQWPRNDEVALTVITFENFRPLGILLQPRNIDTRFHNVYLKKKTTTFNSSD